MSRTALALLASTALLALAHAASAETVQVYQSHDPKLVLGDVAFAGGKTLHMTAGIGSSAYRRPDAPPDVFVTLSDRGANFPCGDAKEIIGLDGDSFCGDVKKGRIYPMPAYTPSIYRIRVGKDGFEILDVLTIKDGLGNPITGLPNPLTVATTETPVGPDGKAMAQDPNAIDAEGLVELADGSFWIGEENAPSIVHVAPDGRILLRVVPAGTEMDFAGANYPVVGGLPAILTKRQANRGIEGLAMSPDERFLWLAVQSPLANPDAAAYKKASNDRLIKVDRATLKVVGEYVYEMTPMKDFPGEEEKAQSTARVSDLRGIDDHRFLIDDRTDKTTRIYEIDVSGATDIHGSKWDDRATSPSLEQTSLADAEITPVKKRLVLDSSIDKRLPGKIEGLAFFGDGSLMLINDDDFGITGEHTTVAKVSGLDIQR